VRFLLLAWGQRYLQQLRERLLTGLALLLAVEEILARGWGAGGKGGFLRRGLLEEGAEDVLLTVATVLVRQVFLPVHHTQNIMQAIKTPAQLRRVSEGGEERGGGRRSDPVVVGFSWGFLDGRR
jgi:hypothetical protein